MIANPRVASHRGPAGWPARITLLLTLPLLFAETAPAASRFKSLCVPENRCTDRRGCPDFVVDRGILSQPFFWELTYDAADCSVIEGEVGAGTREYVSFNTMISNFGPGAITLGDPFDHPEWFDLETCHGHPHIKEYADYRLWTVPGYQRFIALRAANPLACALDIFAAHPDLQTEMVRGNKRGFCLYDVVAHAELSAAPCPAAPDPRTYFGCDFSGLGVCWADIYESFPGFIDGQSIDVQDLPDGEYILENEVNARHFFKEADYSNNAAAVRIRLFHRGPFRRMEILGAP
jgi:hypothetical protein